jgi:hypothetical protein
VQPLKDAVVVPAKTKTANLVSGGTRELKAVPSDVE